MAKWFVSGFVNDAAGKGRYFQLACFFMFFFIVTSGYASADPFNFVVIPDTQSYSEYYPAVFTNQTKWINQSRIKYVIHLGDIVDDAGNSSQWKNANASMYVLDRAKVRYGILAGNHDSNGGTDFVTYSNYFGKWRFSGKSWFGGAYNLDNTHHYDLINVGDRGFLILYISYDNKADLPLSWIKNVISSNPDRYVILVTHAHLDKLGAVLQSPDSAATIQNLAANYSNIILVLSGHISMTPSTVSKKSIRNGAAWGIMQDYQSEPKGGNGWLRKYSIDDNNVVSISTYSPYLNRNAVSFSVTTAPTLSPKTPKFSPSAGTYTSTQTVRISTATLGATIRYTTDGTTPTTSSSTYGGPITVSSSKTIKAIAWKTGMSPSRVASARYVIN